MTVESNCAIAIATLSIWLKNLAPVFQAMRFQTQPISPCTRDFSGFWASYGQLLAMLIGSTRCLLLLWLVRLLILVLFFGQSFQNRSIFQNRLKSEVNVAIKTFVLLIGETVHQLKSRRRQNKKPLEQIPGVEHGTQLPPPWHFHCDSGSCSSIHKKRSL